MATKPAVPLILLIMHLSAILLLLALGSVTGQDCNTKYDILPDLDRRSRNYAVSGPNEPYVSDRYLRSKWYNVLNNSMPTNSANMEAGSSCGTFYPGWLNGTVPGEGNVVSHNVCFVTFTGICGQVRPIQVKNCSTFLLYYLVSTGPSTAYCFDSFKDFEGKYFPPHIFRQSGVPLPAPEFLPGFIAVQHELIFTKVEPTNNNEYYKPRLKFQCNFTESNKAVLYYNVYWYINDNFFLMKGANLYPNKSNSDLLETDLISRGYKLDINIKCGVSASVTEESYLSNRTFSPEFWLGIQVLNSTVFLKQGQTADVLFQSTVPFGCNSYLSTGPKCVLSIQMIDPNDTYDCGENSISVNSYDLCGSELPGVTYKQWFDGIRYYNTTKMTITTRDSDIYDSASRTFRLSLVAIASDVNDIMNYTKLKDITVQVIGEKVWQEKKCHANVDPHMLSFDGRRYENQNPGVFIMYNNTKFKQQVQIKTMDCWRGATCACAVCVRAGGDVFVLHRCENKSFIDFVSCKENIIDVRRPKESPNMYEIHLPLGTIVTVSINSWPTYGSTMNVLITPAIKDVNETEGLCGLLNGDQGDDWMKRNGNIANDNNEFSLSWRINYSESFLDPNYDPDVWEMTARFCVCPNGTGINEDETNNVQPIEPVCSSSMFLTCKRKIDPKTETYGNCTIRTKRSNASRKREIQRIFKETTREAGHTHRIPDSTNLHQLGKRSTYEDSYAMCSEIFSSNCSTAAFENGLPKITQNSKNIALINCALDYQITGDANLANIHCESYRIESEMEIKKNETFREVHADVVKSFESATCINNCYGHGNCVNGTCRCHASYIENDCSVSLNDYPAVDDTYAGGLCKKDKDVCCGELPIYGSRFVQGITHQKVEVFQIDINGTFKVVETTETNLTVNNPFQAEMSVPCTLRKSQSTDTDTVIFVWGIRLSLTNDGTNYGSTQRFYIYDTNCQGVSKNTTEYNFYIMDGKCFINNVCYSENQRNPSDSCRMCQPLVNPYFWTGECSSSKTDVQSSSDITMIIVAVTVPSGILVIIIATIVIIKCCIRKKKRYCLSTDKNCQQRSGTTMPHRATFNTDNGQHKEYESAIQSKEQTYDQLQPREENSGTPDATSLDE